MIPEGWFQKYKYVMIFTSYDMVEKFEEYADNK